MTAMRMFFLALALVAGSCSLVGASIPCPISVDTSKLNKEQIEALIVATSIWNSSLSALTLAPKAGGDIFVEPAESIVHTSPTVLAYYNIPLRGIVFLSTLRGQELTTILTHELGHALGIYEHSPNPRSVMFWAPYWGTVPDVHDVALAKQATICDTIK